MPPAPDQDLIVTIIKKGYAERIIEASREAGAEGATITFGRGTGVHAVSYTHLDVYKRQDLHRLAGENPGVNSADAGKAQRTLFFDFGDHRPDLVHMGHQGQREGLLAGVLSFLVSYQVAQAIPPHPGRIALQIAGGYRGGALLASGYPDSAGELHDQLFYLFFFHQANSL